MIYFKSIVRAFTSLVLGVGFGLSTFWVIFISKMMFSTPVNTADSLNVYVIMFLCLGVISSAAVDVLLSNSFSWGWRLFIFSASAFALLMLYILFSPNNSNPPNPRLLSSFAVGYEIFTFFYFMAFKTILYYNDALNDRRKSVFNY